jgi:HSP90 family molecular chaperone
LISNSSDSLEKRRFIDASSEKSSAQDLEIRIETGKNTIVVEDTGVGMNKEELVNLLGTIARSGSKEFRETDKETSNSIIGQFGVGFYSAFMVAGKIFMR